MSLKDLEHLIDLRDLLDVISVAFLIYWITYFLFITRGIQILRGILVVGLFWLFSEILKLRTLSWIFEKLWTVGLFSLVVIFQPEIRNALAKLGQRYSLRGSSPREKLVDKLVRVCSFLSQRQIGALIVVERKQSLESLLEGCVFLDSNLSIELLISIFFPKSPLHDGAVVIKGDRIAYASCVLPLSRRKDLPTKFGTRHRAGIGITEESDAVAIIVSEESGEISLAVGGKIETNLEPEILRDRLNLLLS